LYCLLTRGEAGSDGTPPEQSATIREAEERETARVVGVDTAEFLGLPDGVLEDGVSLRREITRVVRRHKPEIVITLNFAERWAGGGFNTADHIACGRATMDAVRDAGNRWIFPEQISDEGLEKWDGVRAVWVDGSPDNRRAVDITDTFEPGVESLKAHRKYLDRLGWETFDPAESLEGMARQTGSRLGVPITVGLEVHDLGGG
jgi:LmbE family N-acetylglucosaminyl deacetylase